MNNMKWSRIIAVNDVVRMISVSIEILESSVSCKLMNENTINPIPRSIYLSYDFLNLFQLMALYILLIF